MTHMAPETLMEGRMSKAGDVYAFGITLWEVRVAAVNCRASATLVQYGAVRNTRHMYGLITPYIFVYMCDTS